MSRISMGVALCAVVAVSLTSCGVLDDAPVDPAAHTTTETITETIAETATLPAPKPASGSGAAPVEVCTGPWREAALAADLIPAEDVLGSEIAVAIGIGGDGELGGQNMPMCVYQASDGSVVSVMGTPMTRADFEAAGADIDDQSAGGLAWYTARMPSGDPQGLGGTCVAAIDVPSGSVHVTHVAGPRLDASCEKASQWMSAIAGHLPEGSR